MSFLLSLSTLVISETFDPEEIEILAVLLLAVYVAYNASREYRSRIQQLQLDQFSDVNEELGQSNAIEELGLPDVSEELGQSDVTEELGQSDASEELGQSDASEELGKSDASEELGQSDVSEELGLQHSPHATHFSRLCLGFRCFFRSVWDLAVLLVWMALLYGSLLLILLLIVLAITCSRQDANALRAFFNKQNWGVKPVHPLAENFPPACPPNYRFYPNYERVLGIPGPLYPDLHPPFSTVRKYYRQTMKCWHGDKRGNYPFLSNQQWHEIQRLVDDSYLKLTYTGMRARVLVWPRFVEAPKEKYGVVDLEDSTFWKTWLHTESVALYEPNCTCTLTHALNRVAPLNPKTEAELRTYCPCTIDMVLETYRWFWDNNMPPLGIHSWYKESDELHPTSSLQDLAVYLLGNKFFLPFVLRDCEYLPEAEKRRLIQEMWFDLGDFWEDTKEGGPLHDLAQQREAELDAERQDYYWRMLAQGKGMLEMEMKARAEALARRFWFW